MKHVYVVSYDHLYDYESGGVLYLCDSYDKAFDYLETLVKGRKHEFPELWVDDNFNRLKQLQSRVDDGWGETRWQYRMPEPDDTYYTIDVRPVH